METEGMDQYLDTFKYGMPPHGGLGIGLERLTMQLLGQENVREACAVPKRPVTDWSHNKADIQKSSYDIVDCNNFCAGG